MRFYIALIGLLVVCMPGWAEPLFNEQGYRIDNYRRATPPTAPAGQMLDTDQLSQLLKTSNPVLIDVQAVTVRPETEAFGFAWLPGKTRWHIPGSTWLPNVGYGELDARMTRYFRSNLKRLTKGDKGRAVVLYCVVDCWMSWNAVRRAAEWGYRKLYWYPEGTDGWEQAGLELVQATPYPLKLDSSDEPAAEFFSRFDQLDLKQVAEQARQSNRDILLFFETRHCPYCLRMKKSVLIDSGVIEALHEKFIALAIDIESSSPLRDLNGKLTSEREFAKSGYRIVRTPTLVFVDADFNLLHKHSGLVATSEEMNKLFAFVASRAYDEVSWREYKSR